MSSRPELPMAGADDSLPRVLQTYSAASTTPSSTTTTTTASASRRARSRAVNSGDFFLAQQLRSPGGPPLSSPQDRHCCPQTYLDLVRSWRCPPFRAATSQLGHYHRELPLLKSSCSSPYASFRPPTGPCEAEAIRRAR